MDQPHFYKTSKQKYIALLFPITSMICFLFTLTTLLDFPNSKPWDIVALFEAFGFISFVSKYPPIFFMILGGIIVLFILVVLFFVIRWFQKIEFKNERIPVVSLLLTGAMIAFMMTTTQLHQFIHNYYKQGNNQGRITERIQIVDYLSEAMKAGTHPSDSINKEEAVLIDKNGRIVKVVTVNNVRTIKVYDDP